MIDYRFIFSSPGTTPRLSTGSAGLPFGFTALGLRTSRLDRFWAFATMKYLWIQQKCCLPQDSQPKEFLIVKEALPDRMTLSMAARRNTYVVVLCHNYKERC
jgi:hypothetical protein